MIGDERVLVGALAVLHGGCALLWGAMVLTRSKRLADAAVWAFALAFLINTLILALKWVEAGRAPFKTLYETMLLYPWCVTLVTLVLVRMYRLTVLIPFSSGAALFGLVYAMMRPDIEVVNLPPALQSPWFVPHVVTYFVAYAALFVSFALACLSLAKPGWRAAGTDAGFEDYAHRSVRFGFTALTLGLVMGAVWGKVAWGDYWSWDPKENWALVTWLAYLAYLHLRLTQGWQGRRSMVVCVVSFLSVVFTYLGMNLLPAASDSLHVYQ